MQNKLSCEIVQDLLPSYVDGLTSAVTNQAIEDHAKNCPSCQESLKAMGAPELSQEEFEEKQEIDFLKKTKKRTRRIIVGSVIGIVIIALIVIFMRFYVVGSPLYSESVACKVDVYGDTLTVSGAVVDSAIGVSDIIYTEENGVVTISFKGTMASPFHSGDFKEEYQASTNITQVRIGERIVWDGGNKISANVSAVYNTKHPYVGDMPANGATANALGIDHVLGGYLNELQTTEEPYGWTLEMQDDYTAKDGETIQLKMAGYACVLLAMIDNLNVVTYEYTIEGVPEVYVFTSEMATDMIGKDIKLCGATPTALQELMEQLDLDSYAAASQRNDAQSIFLNIVNATDEEIHSIGMEYGVNGEYIGGQGATRADGEPLSQGESVRLELDKTNLQDVELDDTTEIQVTVTVGIRTPGTEFGEELHNVTNQIILTGELGLDYNYVLTGNVSDGFLIE